ncbi:MAG: ABC transporter permease [Oscillospiraceae bacterium]|nr:ABC transporter permease [Oscillospiraceae bacterium]
MDYQRLLYDAISCGAPIILCVLGGNFAHKANVLNIALEGMLLMGAFTSVLFTMLTKNILLGILICILINLIWGIVFSVMCVTKKGNPIIAGLAVNMLATAICAFLLKVLGMANLNVNSIVNVAGLKIQIPVINQIPFIGGIISGHPLMTYVSFIAIFVMWVIMYKTKFGVYVRVVGENEDAAVSVGINVNRIRYIAVLIGAVCSALAGINLSLEKMALFTNDMSAGIGFIAIAAIFCGSGRPGLTSIYAIIFGLAQSLAINLSISAGAYSGLFNTIPYFMIVFILAVVSIIKMKNNRVRGFKNE